MGFALQDLRGVFLKHQEIPRGVLFFLLTWRFSSTLE